MGKLSNIQCIHFIIISFLLLTTHGQVSGVAFDSYWSSPTSDGSGENVMYRFGSVGQVQK